MDLLSLKLIFVALIFAMITASERGQSLITQPIINGLIVISDRGWAIIQSIINSLFPRQAEGGK